MKLLILTCFTLCLVACEAQTNCPAQLTCPAYWSLNGNSCYRTFGLAQTFQRASRVCQLFTSCGSTGTGSGKGQLVSINSDEENQFLFSLQAGRYGEIPPPPTWIGLSDVDPQGQQGIFRWADGTILDSNTYSAWASNFPMQNGNLNCAIFGELILPRWIDINCEEELPFTCELPPSISACSAASTPPPNNPPPPSPVLTSPNKPKFIRYSTKKNKYSEPV